MCTDGFANQFRNLAEEKNCKVLGVYQCKGYDTFGPFKLAGGIGKGHPTDGEIKGAVNFYNVIVAGR